MGSLALSGDLGAAWFALGWPWLSGQVTIPWDAKAHFYPQLQFLAQSIHRGEWPFWNPYIFAGHPQIADPQSLIFSPPFLALAALTPEPSFRAADATILGMLLLGAIAVLLLARDRGWHPAAALLAAIVFAYGGSAAWRIQHLGQILSLSYWPIAWLLLARALDRASPTYGFAAGIVAGFMVLGRDQVAYLAVWLLVGVVICHVIFAPLPRVALRKALGPLAAGLAAGLLVATVPLVLTILLNADSNRFVIDSAGAGRGSLHPALLLTAAVPQLFGAAGPLAEHWGPPSPAWGPVDLYLARNMGQIYFGALPLAALFGARLAARLVSAAGDKRHRVGNIGSRSSTRLAATRPCWHSPSISCPGFRCSGVRRTRPSCSPRWRDFAQPICSIDGLHQRRSPECVGCCFARSLASPQVWRLRPGSPTRKVGWIMPCGRWRNPRFLPLWRS